VGAISIDNNNDDLEPINLTDILLTDDQKKVLKKGPKFCSAPKDVNWMKMTDWKRFERRIRLTAYHHGRKVEQEQDDNSTEEEDVEEIYPKVHGPGRYWNPPKSSIPEIEVFLATLKRERFNPNNLRVAKDN